MDRATVDAYEARGPEWARNREPIHRQEAIAFGRVVAKGALRLDAGAGGGRYTNDLGSPIVALDAARSMLEVVAVEAPGAMRVQADLEALPFRVGAFAGAWASMSYVHVTRERWPVALADLHRSLAVGALVEVSTRFGEFDGVDPRGDSIGGRFFAGLDEQAMADLLEGAGFEVDRVSSDRHETVRGRGRRAVSLADTVGPGMRLLVCGLNPSVYSAERGVGYARPGNRFWKAALAAGLVSRPLDPMHALREHAVGITDLCKRASTRSSARTADEYRHGVDRVRRLVEWLRPGAVVFVGLEGFRAAVDRKAAAGPVTGGFGGRPAYVMPSTSGQVVGLTIDDYAAHLRAAVHH